MKAGKVILLTPSPIFCPCVTDPFKKGKKKGLVAPLTVNKHSQLRRKFAANPSKQQSIVVGLFFIYKEMKNNVGLDSLSTLKNAIPNESQVTKTPLLCLLLCYFFENTSPLASHHNCI